MNRSYLIILFLLMGILPLTLRGQEATAYPPPTSPFVGPMPENGEWIITVRDGGDQAAPAGGDSKPDPKNPILKDIHVTKTGRMKRDVISYSSGASMEIWYIDDVVLLPTENQEIGVIPVHDFGKPLATNASMLGNPVESPNFTGFDWVDLTDYDQVTSFQGEPCYHYITTKNSSEITLNAPQAPPISAEAWVSVKTGQPVAYTDCDGRVYTYHFLAPPASALTLPPAYQEMLTSYEREMDRKKQLDAAAAIATRR